MASTIKKRATAREEQDKRPPPLKAIRLKCINCMGRSFKKIRLCPASDCALHYYRLGKNPNRKGIGGNPSFKKAN